MITYAVDFESYYTAKEVSISVLGPMGYFTHPMFDAYMVTVVGDDGYKFAGRPEDFDWNLLAGNRVLSHNAAFDETLYFFLVSRGIVPKVEPAEWHCTADLVSCLGIPRSLKEASATVFGIEVSKTTRDNMSGKQWNHMSEEFRKEVTEYAILDAELCLKLWQELEGRWNAFERAVSLTNRRICQRGLPIDSEALKRNLEVINVKLFEAEQSIPWIGDFTALSRKAFNAECRKYGIEPPASMAQDSEEADKWFAKYGAQCAWAKAVQDYRRINSFKGKLESFDAGTMADGRYYGNLLYFGANPTGRFSGSGGNLNLQNLPRDEMFGVNFRSMIKPKDGNVLVVVDLAQIEIRTLLWWAKDKKALELIRSQDKVNGDIYDVIAQMLGLHDPKNGPLRNNKPLRQKVKAMALGCQFGLSGDGFSSYSGMPLDEANAAVEHYRNKMTHVVKLWDDLKKEIALCQSLQQPFVIDMPSGRKMNYGVPRRLKTTGFNGKVRFGYVGKLVRKGQLRDFKLWGGGLSENMAQALARDIFAYMMLKVEEAGFPIILHVHDELVVEVAKDKADSALAEILRIMSQPPEWIPDIPVAAEGKIMEFYAKD